ncbi:MAG: SpoIID/LytB domain-containing protein [Deltaproteobacteria bacterium]
MLLPGIIPDKEPLLRVGIILPEDLEKSVRLDLTSSMNSKLIADGNVINPFRNIEIRTEKGQLVLNDLKFDRIDILQDGIGSFVTVKNVIAGRGFHWAKKIDVKLTNSIIIYNLDDIILMINELPIEQYLACVATSEMSSICPDSYIEAQTIVARSWMLANVEQKHTSLGFDVCNDDCCQRYQGVNNLTDHSRKAANSTRGLVLMYDNKIVDARYSKSCGGTMERFENLWENDPKEYMQNKTDSERQLNIDLTKESDFNIWVNSIPETYCSPHFINESDLHRYLGNVDEKGKYFRWTVDITNEELVSNLNEKMGTSIKYVKFLNPVKRAGSGRLLELEVLYVGTDNSEKKMIIYKDYEIRKLLHRKFLFSSGIIIEPYFIEGNDIPAGFIYHGAGWGHGAGMCQIGGLGMALAGYIRDQILYHYYPGSKINKIY